MKKKNYADFLCNQRHVFSYLENFESTKRLMANFDLEVE